MHSPERNWSFAYSIGTARYSFDVMAESQTEAEGLVRAMAGAVCEGVIVPTNAYAARQSDAVASPA